jgi:hypothetical protein
MKTRMPVIMNMNQHINVKKKIILLSKSMSPRVFNKNVLKLFQFFVFVKTGPISGQGLTPSPQISHGSNRMPGHNSASYDHSGGQQQQPHQQQQSNNGQSSPPISYDSNHAPQGFAQQPGGEGHCKYRFILIVFVRFLNNSLSFLQINYRLLLRRIIIVNHIQC